MRRHIPPPIRLPGAVRDALRERLRHERYRLEERARVAWLEFGEASAVELLARRPAVRR
jgi:hypothetical protein